MRDSYTKYAGLTIRPIDDRDWDAYKDYYKSLKNPKHYSAYFADKDIDAPETKDNFFNDAYKDGNFILFGMWDKNKLIGQTSITFLKNEDTGKLHAYFAGSELRDDYRGRGLVDNLYEARKQYIKDVGFKGDVVMTIAQDNAPSQKAALRNGFEKASKQNKYGFDIFILNSENLQGQVPRQSELPASDNRINQLALL